MQIKIALKFTFPSFLFIFYLAQNLLQFFLFGVFNAGWKNNVEFDIQVTLFQRFSKVFNFKFIFVMNRHAFLLDNFE